MPARAHPVSRRTRRAAAVALSGAAVLVLAGAQSAPASAAASTSSFDPHRGYVQTNLVSDQPGKAKLMDPNLVNAWGMSYGPSTPVWVSDNGADVTTLYTGGIDGAKASAVPLVVSIPDGAPTGQLFNDTSQFVLSDGMPAFFVFASENGSISAWNPALSPNTSAERKGAHKDAVYKGIALLHRGDRPWLLAADFHHGRIDVYNRNFTRLAHLPSWMFNDPNLPAGYGPFNVATIGGKVWVTYAKQDADRHDDVRGAGHGFIDVYGPGGHLLMRFASRGVLNSPWGLAVAPSGFGPFSHDLLVGNFGDGRIHAFDWQGHLLGTLRHATGSPIAIDGLWALLPGNGVAGDRDDVLFSAGPDGESHGLFGTLRSTTDE
jgi:uncharacterized protein (TIGR03118 family)